MKASPVSILGCGNIGTAIAKGLIRSGKYLVSDNGDEYYLNLFFYFKSFLA